MSKVILDFSSTSGLFLDLHNDKNIDHFNWASIRRFIYFSMAYSASGLHFDIFSKIIFHVRLYDFLLYQFTLGVTYMFMVTFIKQYTRKMDFEISLNPLLKAINVGMLIHTIACIVLNTNALTESVKYLMWSLRSEPVWSTCPRNSRGCVTSKDIVLRCYANQSTNIENSSVHISYKKQLVEYQYNTKTFILAFVWSFMFLIASVSDGSLLKIFKLSFVLRAIITISTFCILSLTSMSNSALAFKQLLSIQKTSDGLKKSTLVVARVVYTYGIGLVGMYDIGISPYLMLDNAIIIFSLTFTIFAFLRSLIVRTLYLEHIKCIEMDFIQIMEVDYLIYVILPLSTEFHYAQRFYLYYIYGNLTISLTSYVLVLTLTVAKLLNSQFRSVNNVYMVGIVCLFTFFLNSISSDAYLRDAEFNCLLSLLLGALKTGVIAYIYGLDRFSTDIHYWLGFKPTKFWTVQWLLLPIILLYLFITLLADFIEKVTRAGFTDTFFQFLITSMVVGIVYIILTIKLVLKFLMKNNIMGLFRSSKKYGPPEPEERRNRRNFDETLFRRKCVHDCIVIDELYECNHLPLMSQKGHSKEATAVQSLTNLYQAGPSNNRTSHEFVHFY